jgi:hypothetical protein
MPCAERDTLLELFLEAARARNDAARVDPLFPASLMYTLPVVFRHHPLGPDSSAMFALAAKGQPHKKGHLYPREKIRIQK